MKETFTLQQTPPAPPPLPRAPRPTEKELQALDMENILKIPNITIQDMTVITELQKATKANKLFSYLGGDSDEQQSE